MIAVLLQLILSANPFVPTPASLVFDTEVEAAEVQRWRTACTRIAPNFPKLTQPGRVRLKQAENTEAFVTITGRSRIEAAAVLGQTIWIQPARIFDRIPDANSVRRHECVHLWLRLLQVPPLPRVLEEALATGLSGQARRQPAGEILTEAQLVVAEKALAHPKSRLELETTLQDVVSTIWPLLRDHEAHHLMSLLTVMSKAQRWTSVLLPVGPPRAD